jgi:hypothetical protein
MLHRDLRVAAMGRRAAGVHRGSRFAGRVVRFQKLDTEKGRKESRDLIGSLPAAPSRNASHPKLHEIQTFAERSEKALLSFLPFSVSYFLIRADLTGAHQIGPDRADSGANHCEGACAS